MKSKEYKQELNSIVRTAMKITECAAADKMRDVQLWTILLNSQINVILEIMKKNKIEE